MSAELAIPTKELLSSLREMVRQWRQNGSRLDSTGRAPPSNTNTVAPIVQAIEVTSSTADAYGYPARIQTYNGTAWSDTYAECRAVQIGSTIAGAVLATGFYPAGRLMTVAGGYHVYGVHPGGVNQLDIEEVGGSPSVTNATKLQLPNSAMSNPSAGVARLLEASTTTGGTVNLSDQVLGLNCKAVASLMVGSVDFATWDAGSAHFASSINIGEYNATLEYISFLIDDSTGADVGGNIMFNGYNNSATDMGHEFIITPTDPTAGLGSVKIGDWLPGTADRFTGIAACDYGMSPTSGRYGYAVWHHNLNSWSFGQSGTILYGATATDGIVTNLGSAITPGAITGFDESAQDAVGTILVDTATVNLTYTDGTPSITADVITGTSGASIPLLNGNNTYSGSADFTDSFALSGDISPAQLTANTNNWNPTGW